MSESQAKATEYNRCKSNTRDGSPCRAWAGEDGYCFSHDPALAAKRAEARAKGGRNSARSARLRALVPPRLLPVYDKLETALDETHNGTLKPSQAGAMAALARAMVAVLTSGELEDRVRDIENRLTEGKT
ncbi:MAG: hypothetical protein JRN22_00425 [Nitrososphaerota archaeon]|nr:hypothetical protein [Nitrososphaerota archaeon]